MYTGSNPVECTINMKIKRKIICLQRDLIEINIDKDIPIPETKVILPKSQSYPFSEMKSGDSFWVPRELENSVRASASQRRRRYPGECYTSRQDRDGIRIWRL